MTPPHYNQMATQLVEAERTIEALAEALGQFITAPFSNKTHKAMDSYLKYAQHYPKGGQSRATKANTNGGSKA